MDITKVNWGALTHKEAQDIWNSLSGAEKDVLMQLREVTWDGNLVSKVGRSELVRKGLATQYEGYQVVSPKGLILLESLGKLESLTSGHVWNGL